MEAKNIYEDTNVFPNRNFTVTKVMRNALFAIIIIIKFFYKRNKCFPFKSKTIALELSP
jgi:hypothetical protein